LRFERRWDLDEEELEVDVDVDADVDVEVGADAEGDGDAKKLKDEVDETELAEGAELCFVKGVFRGCGCVRSNLFGGTEAERLKLVWGGRCASITFITSPVR
jgi:hypothetical protein